MMEDVSLEELLPHRAPMILLDAVEEFNAEERRVVAKVTIGPGQIFFDGTGVPNWAAIEYMAQAAALLTGLQDHARDEPARPGFLLGTRSLTLSCERFVAGETYRVTARCEFEDGGAAAFACAIADARGDVVATAMLNAFRPADVKTFLERETT